MGNSSPAEGTHHSEDERAAVFRLTSRINHSCQPNATAVWSRKLQRMRVHCLVAMAPRTELRIDYRSGEGGTRAERRTRLHDHTKYPAATASDARRIALYTAVPVVLSYQL